MSKDIKTLLKAAREAIRAKDYKEAILKCKSVLRQDKTNYNALVFVGVAAEGLDQSDQAITAFKKAIQVDEAQPLAWQGLCGFYEKANKDEYRNDLLEAYTKLSDILSGDINRRFEIQLKLANLHKTCGDFNKSIDTFKDALATVSDDSGKSRQVWTHLVHNLSEEKDLAEEHRALLVKSYEHLLHNQDGADPEPAETWIAYLQLLCKERVEPEKLRRECLLMSTHFPSAKFPLHLLCQVELDTYAETRNPAAARALEAQVATLEEVDPGSVYATFSQACELLVRDQHKSAIELLRAGTKALRGLASGWILLGFTQSKLHDNAGVNISVTRALKLLADVEPRWTGEKTQMETSLKLLQAKAQIEICKPTGLTAAVRTLSAMRSQVSDPEVLLYLGYAHLAQGDTDMVTEVLGDLEFTGDDRRAAMLRGWQCFYADQLTDAEQSLSDVSAPPGQVLYQLGRIYWAMSELNNEYTEKCFTTLLQAAKLDPYYSPTFYSLGLYYHQVVKDNARARRCYQKAYDLDTDNDEAGCALCDMLSAEGEEEAVIAMLLVVTQKASAGSAKWAWLRLGLNQMKVEEHAASVMSLQAALRADNKDSHVWECLGEAYLSRGSYTAALKAFTKATELNPDAMYCFYQIATLQQVLGAYTEAVKQFEVILEKSPDYVPALKGVGETHILQARAALTKFFHGRAMDHCETAINHLTRAAAQRPDMSCLWKLLGDACTILHPVSDKKLKLSIPMRLLSADTQSQDMVTVTKQQLIALGGRCYGMGLKQVADCASLWHDLGVNNFLQSRLREGPDAKASVAKATQCLQKAVTLDPENHCNWLALGLVAASDELDNPALAQHCFIKSIKAEQNNVAAWVALGTLYLQDNQVELAHEAYKMAQSLEPLYVASWVGQALIAESMDHYDTMDLFRHTTVLANHTEGALGYAWWVVSVLADKARLKPEVHRYTMEQMAAVPAASDALARYIDRVKTNPIAYNMHGLLLEKQGLPQQATDAFKNAVELLEQGPTNQLRDTRSNYARLLGMSGCHEKAVQMYEACGDPYTFEETCGMALALYKAEQYEASMKAYGRALEMAETDDDRSHVQAAVGLVAYKAGDSQTAKTLLFKCSQNTCPSVQGLLALAGLGLLEADTRLAAAVLQEVEKLGHQEEHASSILFLTARVMAIQGNASTGLAYIQKEIRRRPFTASYWQTLAHYLIQYSPGCAQVAASCGQAAQRIQASSDKDLSSIQSVAALAAGLHSRSDSQNNAFTLVQKAVHLHPDLVSQWCTLLGAIHAEHVVRQAIGAGSGLDHTAMSLAAHLMAKVESELSQGSGDRRELAALHLWSVKQYIVTLLSLGRTAQAQQFLQQAMWLYDNDPVLKSLSASLDQNFRGMRLAVNEQQQTPFLWQLLVEGLKGQGLFQEVEKTIKQWLQSSGSRPAKLVPLIQLTHVAYTQIIAGQTQAKWHALLSEASTEALKIDPQCSTVHLMVGLIQLNDSKKRRYARHSFTETLCGYRAGSLPATHTTARRHLYDLYTERGEADKVKSLVDDAKEHGDKEFMDFYKHIKKADPAQKEQASGD